MVGECNDQYSEGPWNAETCGYSTFTSWRFPIQIQLGVNEICIKYRINGGMKLSFFVPAHHQNMR
jgi:hypothetical protein